jgi:hypothetical protein
MSRQVAMFWVAGILLSPSSGSTPLLSDVLLVPAKLLLRYEREYMGRDPSLWNCLPFSVFVVVVICLGCVCVFSL